MRPPLRPPCALMLRGGRSLHRPAPARRVTAADLLRSRPCHFCVWSVVVMESSNRTSDDESLEHGVALKGNGEVHVRISNFPHSCWAYGVQVTQDKPLTSAKLAHPVSTNRYVTRAVVAVRAVVRDQPAVVVSVFPRSEQHDLINCALVLRRISLFVQAVRCCLIGSNWCIIRLVFDVETFVTAWMLPSVNALVPVATLLADMVTWA